MSNWISEFFKLAKEDSFVKWIVRIVVLALALFILFLFYLLGRTLYHGHTAKIANHDFSFPDSDKNKKDFTASSSLKKAKLNDTVNLHPIKSLPAYKKNNPLTESKGDTPKKQIQPPTQLNQTGKNNFNGGNGIYNAPIHNGDEYINKEIQFSNSEMEWFFNHVLHKMDSLKVTSKRLLISTQHDSNAPQLANQIVGYFKDRGFEILGNGVSLSDANSGRQNGFGYSAGFNKTAIVIDIGYFEKKNN